MYFYHNFIKNHINNDFLFTSDGVEPFTEILHTYQAPKKNIMQNKIIVKLQRKGMEQKLVLHAFIMSKATGDIK